jgi:hypothetical protein
MTIAGASLPPLLQHLGLHGPSGRDPSYQPQINLPLTGIPTLLSLIITDCKVWVGSDHAPKGNASSPWPLLKRVELGGWYYSVEEGHIYNTLINRSPKLVDLKLSYLRHTGTQYAARGGVHVTPAHRDWVWPTGLVSLSIDYPLADHQELMEGIIHCSSSTIKKLELLTWVPYVYQDASSTKKTAPVIIDVKPLIAFQKLSFLTFNFKKAQEVKNLTQLLQSLPMLEYVNDRPYDATSHTSSSSSW